MPLVQPDLASLGRADLSHRRPANLDRFRFGVVYYPEHWDADTRSRDPERMAAAGIDIVRMGEFAWDLIEPEEGRYDFALFDDTIARLGERGIDTIFCTPTATPPRWLTLRHPGIQRVDNEGRTMVHGSRQHPCHMNPLFRDYSRRVTRDLARHYAGNRHVVGWQTDNEFHCHFSECHCAACQVGFQEFLGRTYGDVGALNRAWGTAFWAQTYRAFAEVPTPRKDKPTYLNPAHELSYYRYLSDGVTRFQRDQVEELRAADRRWFITHNGTFGHIQYRGAFSRDLDLLGYDSYPMFTWDPEDRAKGAIYGLDRARSFAGNFIVPEQQAGAGGQRPYFHDAPEPGEMRQQAYQSIAHGADSLLFFRWRTCRFGAEEYWTGIIDHDDVPRRRYDELARMGRELRAVGPAVIGTSVHIDAAVAAGDVDVGDAHATYTLGLPGDDEAARAVHGALFDRGIAVGCVHPDDDLAGLKLYVLPHWAYFDPAWTANLRRFVEAGGTLVIGARTATRDTDNNVVAATLPGCLRDLVGATVIEYGKQNRPDRRPLTLVAEGGEAVSAHWYETLQPDPGTSAFATWRGRAIDGAVAATVRTLGRGRVVYVGTYLLGATLDLLLPSLVSLSGLTPLWPAPARVHVALRTGAGRKVWFFFNHTDATVRLEKLPKGVDLTRGAPVAASVELERHGVLIIREG